MVRFLTLFLFLILSTAGAVASPPASDKPLLIIWDNPHYPAPSDAQFTGGAVAIIWPDGRIIRAGSQSGVGQDYIEGRIDQNDFKDFSSFLLSAKNLGTPDINSVAPDAASETVVVYSGDKKHQWTWGLPEKQDMLAEIEDRVWKFSIKEAHSLDTKSVDLDKFNPSKVKK